MTVAPVVTVRAVPVEEVLDLRWRVLRPGRPRDTARCDGDEDPATVALAGWVVAADPPAGSTADRGSAVAGPVSTITLMTQACPWRPGLPAVRLRAVATDTAVRGRGVGSAVLAEALGRARAAGAALVWCHARAGALTFYTRAGFVVDGEAFDVPGIGPHLHLHVALDGAPAPPARPATG